MPTITNPRTRSEELYTERQEWYRKDIERAFGVLQLRFKIVKQAARSWSSRKMGDIMYTCCILHNMILQDRNLLFVDQTAAMRDAVDQGRYQVRRCPLCESARLTDLQVRPSAGLAGMSQAQVVDTYLRNTRLMWSAARHKKRKADLVNHLSHLYEHKHPPFA